MAARFSAPRDLEPGFLPPFVILSGIVAGIVFASTIFTLIAA